MKADTLSLVHLVQEPREKLSGPPPLLLLLHGIGSNEADLFGLAAHVDGHFFIVSARAPLDLGYGYAWFNIEFTPQGMTANLDQAEQSRVRLLKFVDELIATYGVDPAGVYPMGFSQGAMMSLGLALTRPEGVAGAVAMSGRMPSRRLLQMAAPEILRGLPVFISHGIYDPVLPIEHGRACRDELESLPVKLTYREYPMGHEVSMESLGDINTWLSSTLDENLRQRGQP